MCGGEWLRCLFPEPDDGTHCWAASWAYGLPLTALYPQPGGDVGVVATGLRGIVLAAGEVGDLGAVLVLWPTGLREMPCAACGRVAWAFALASVPAQYGALVVVAAMMVILLLT
jgi:hypothetical protein